MPSTCACAVNAKMTMLSAVSGPKPRSSSTLWSRFGRAQSSSSSSPHDAAPLINLVILLVATYFLRIRTLNAAEEKAARGHEPLEGDLAWDKKTTAVYPALCVFAGVAAGLLGIGGGMVLGPLLVELGCLPQPIAATSAYVVFITATAGLAQVTILGLLPGDYALLFSCFGVFATFLGQTAVDYVVKKYKKDAIVILVIGAIMIIALVLMAYNGIMQMIYAENYGFSPLC